MGGQVGLGAGKQARHDPEVEQDRAGPRPVDTDHSRPQGCGPREPKPEEGWGGEFQYQKRGRNCAQG